MDPLNFDLNPIMGGGGGMLDLDDDELQVVRFTELTFS